jgi:carboxymethylenebutenolidase
MGMASAGMFVPMYVAGMVVVHGMPHVALKPAREPQMMILSPEQQAMVALFQRHVDAELAGDLETTMATMTDDPHLNHVSSMAGGVGRDGVRAFYRDHLVGKFFPPDVKMTNVSRTVGQDQVVEELVISFTHTTPMDWLLPGVPPTGKPVEIAVVVIVAFKDGKISHEHIYWDQAGVLVQVGLLDPAGLPVSGAESARKVLDPKLPPRRM